MMRGLFIFVLYQFLNSIINGFLIRIPRQQEDTVGTPRVSVLIPARNEEENIGQCVQSLLMQDYPNYEIVVLNDSSEDGTTTVLKNINSEKLKVIESKDVLPEGWTGKNWACYRLFLNSTGEIVIFTDADTIHSSNMISTMVQEMERRNLSFASGIPRELITTFGERITVPFMNYSIVSIFPIFLNYLSPVFNMFSVANGQFLMFKRCAYEQIGGHAAVKEEIVEDIELSKLVCKHGMKVGMYNLSNLVSCRMYRGFREAFKGLSKSYFALFGMRIIPSLFVWTWMLIVGIYPLFSLLEPAHRLLALETICMTMLIWYETSLNYKLPRHIVFYYPLINLVNSLIGFHSIITGLQGNTSWKGRTISVKKPRWF